MANRNLLAWLVPILLIMILPEKSTHAETLDKKNQEMVFYQIVIGATAKDFERDDTATAESTGDAQGTTVLWLNGDPLGFYSRGMLVRSVNQWLQPGKNELTLSGKHKKPVYIKVIQSKGKSANENRFMGVVGKQSFQEAKTEKQAKPLIFEVNDATKLPQREELQDRADARKRYEKEIQDLIAELKEAIRTHKGKKAARLLHGGELLWARPAYGYGNKVKDVDETARFFSDDRTKLVAEDRPLRLHFGKRAVLVCLETTEERKDDSSTLTIEHGKNRQQVGPFQLARVDGKWVIWNLPQSLVIRWQGGN